MGGGPETDRSLVKLYQMAAPHATPRSERTPFRFEKETSTGANWVVPAGVARLIGQMQVKAHGLNPYLRPIQDFDRIHDYLKNNNQAPCQASCYHSDELLAWARWGRMGSPGGWAHGTDIPICLVDQLVMKAGEFAAGACSRILEQVERDATTDGATALYVPLNIAFGDLEALLESKGYLPADVHSIRPPLQLIRPSKPIPPEIRVRHARAGEEDRLLVLLLEEWAFLTSFHPTLGSAWKPETGGPLLRQNLALALNRDSAQSETLILVAEKGNELLGVAYFRLVEVADEANMMPPGMHVVLEDIAVRSDARGKGIGRALIQDSFDTFRRRNVAAFSISYVAQNPIARRIWPHLGFRTYQRGFVKTLLSP